MADGFDEVFVATRRQLRGVAESLIAGPQYRASDTIRLAVRPAGFTGVVLPVSVQGMELRWQQGSARRWPVRSSRSPRQQVWSSARPPASTTSSSQTSTAAASPW